MSDLPLGAPARLVRQLAEARVDFVLVGGLAVAVHGHPRATQDVDMVYSTDAGSCERLAQVLRDADSRIEFADVPAAVDGTLADSLREGGHFRFSTDAGGLDAISWSQGKTFAELRADATQILIDGDELLVCSYEDLVAMKRAAGRPQDVADLEALAAIRQEPADE